MAKTILEVENLHKSFGATEVLHGVSFSLCEGDVLSIIGSSGSGKTTLLRCLTALEQADIGKISVDGNTIYESDGAKNHRPVSTKEYQKYFGLVFQSFNLFPQYSVLKNLTLAPLIRAKSNSDFARDNAPDQIYKKALDLLSEVGLSDKKDSYPCELSGGQQQRVAIARALMLSPKILCFDEPTSALDPELTGEVLRVIRSLCDIGITMIIVTHEMSFARDVSDEVLFMHDGNILERGEPHALFENPATERLRSFLSTVNR